MNDALLTGGGVTLRRAGDGERAGVERLQQAAYARNRVLLGLEPVPLLADYALLFRDHEVWVLPSVECDGEFQAALILETERTGDIVIWSVSTAPSIQKQGVGRALLRCAEQRAHELGRDAIRLYTGKPLIHLIDWYGRNGYEVEREEQLADRVLVHMIKKLT